MEIGVDSFAAIIPDPATGKIISAAERMERLLDEVAIADRVGLDVFGVGEHHRKEFLDAAPAVILAAAAARTRQIRLTSAVTVLSAADPVRVFQEFATLDLIANVRRQFVRYADLRKMSAWAPCPALSFAPRPRKQRYPQSNGTTLAGHLSME
jgi:hypothetical protein